MNFGGAALTMVIAAALGWRSSLLPAPLTEVLTYASSPFLLDGALTAVEIAALAMASGVALGLMLALMRLSPLPPLQGTAWLYIWFIRGTPLILQLVFLYDALPVVGIKLDSFTTAVVGFMLNEAAFSAEIIRRHTFGGPQAKPRRGLLRHGTVSDSSAHHPASSHARHSARHGQPNHLHDQGDLDRVRDLRQRTQVPLPAWVRTSNFLRCLRPLASSISS
jgi:His/Glu/Gln/Arg/opine family amino acid ABC transporter permease subunit